MSKKSFQKIRTRPKFRIDPSINYNHYEKNLVNELDNEDEILSEIVQEYSSTYIDYILDEISQLLDLIEKNENHMNRDLEMRLKRLKTNLEGIITIAEFD